MTVIAKNAQRYPVSALCDCLGVARATYYRRKESPYKRDQKDPLEKEVIEEFEKSRKTYGTRRIKAALAKQGHTISRRRIGRIMKDNDLTFAYRKPKPKTQQKNTKKEAVCPNILNRVFDGYDPHTHLASDLTYVRVGEHFNYVCLLIDLATREIAGYGVSTHKDASLVKKTFASLDFPLTEVEIFHSDGGSEFINEEIDQVLSVFDITRSKSRPANPYDNAVVEATNKALKAEFIDREVFETTHELQVKLSDYVHWYNTARLHSTLGYTTPEEYKQKLLSKMSH